ncbi:uncharacterized protein BJ171DRAFT_309618 [Polychytrium aggregatum]|uniref:uncharacterized protein n=1 Tax=Polychytrium aggregatum TaxID=110093 RepID=UPI0022FDCC5E|nr:uncharacterized protein BJ171DRAFT_309618 [Polychytrium aggregatum]KAI9206970.1 hypothetical protein BJ171DRAFT_309618 [Polychytrium aggregatum]
MIRSLKSSLGRLQLSVAHIVDGLDRQSLPTSNPDQSYVIHIHTTNVLQFFETRDPHPFQPRQLCAGAEAHITREIEEADSRGLLSSSSSISLSVSFSEPPSDPAYLQRITNGDLKAISLEQWQDPDFRSELIEKCQSDLQAAIVAHYAFILRGLELEITGNTQRNFLSLGFGFTILLVSVVLSSFIEHYRQLHTAAASAASTQDGPEAHSNWTVLVNHGGWASILEIIGWVALWRPLENFFFSANPLWERKALLTKMSLANVRVIYDPYAGPYAKTV